MISPVYRQPAARALFGSDRSQVMPATLWAGWIGEAGELTATRTPIANTDATFGASGNGVTNVAPIDAGVAEGSWTLVALGLWDAPSGAGLVFTAPLPEPRAVVVDERLTIAAGGLVLEVTA